MSIVTESVRTGITVGVAVEARPLGPEAGMNRA